MAAEPSNPFQEYLSVQRQYDREIMRILEKAAKDLQKRIAALKLQDGVGARVRAAQLQLVLNEIRREQASMWASIGKDIQAGRKEAAEAAMAALDDLTSVAYASLSDEAAEALVEGLRATAQAGINANYARIPRELAERVYRNGVVASGKIEDLIRQGIIQGLSAKELAKTVYQYVSPTMPGGASYAAMRLARTEINNAFHEQQIIAARAPGVSGVKWNLSRSHPKPDDCDEFARKDVDHLGPGVYKVGNVPKKPHPHCFCFLTYVQMDPDQFAKALNRGDFDDELTRRTQENLERLGARNAPTGNPLRRQGSVAHETPDQQILRTQRVGTAHGDASNRLYDDFKSDKYFRRTATPPVDSLPSVRQYFGNSDRFNNALRSVDGPDAATQSLIDEIDAALGKTTTAKPMVVYRGVSSKVIGDKGVGDVVTDPAYWSTSMDHGQARKFARGDGDKVLHIEVPKGTNVIAENASESEVLLGHGTSIQILRIDGDDIYAVLLLG